LGEKREREKSERVGLNTKLETKTRGLSHFTQQHSESRKFLKSREVGFGMGFLCGHKKHNMGGRLLKNFAMGRFGS
jgi:hypothetical protein